jgi:hypothetical protein
MGPVDPGARVVVREMSQALVDGGLDLRRPIVISLEEVRNLSHASPREFDQMRGRLAAVLSNAGAIESMEFVVDSPSPAMLLHGTAYLVTSDGIDQWELFLSLKPADRDWFAWQGRGPVRVIRQPRPNTQQIYYPIPLQ